MSTKLLLVESPHKAQSISKFLGKDFIVLASYGHITDLAKGGKHGIGIDIDNEFKTHYVLQKDKVSVLEKILEAAKNVNEIILLTDNDREGFCISYQLQERLSGINIPIKRGVFNEITKKSVLKAIKEAGPINMNIVWAGTGRRVLDRIVGFKASPFLQNSINAASAGRVQSVLTRMIIERQEQIDSFIPVDFWTLQANLIKGKDNFTTKYPFKINDQKTADDLKSKLNNQDFIVSEVLAEEDKKYPDPPFITSSIQGYMSKKHGFDAERTMKSLQKLYENGFCTYLRTDSKRCSDEAIEEARKFIKSSNFELVKKPYIYANSDAAQDAHECLRPCDLNIHPDTQTEITDPDQKLVYETIYRYFVASQMAPSIFNTLKVTVHPQNDPTIKLKVSGKALKSPGYLEMLNITDNSSIDIPFLQVGDIVKLSLNGIKVEKKQTQPPPRFSEDKLIKELVAKNIGRPATYADLLSKVTARNYVEKKGQIYFPTALGSQVTHLLCKYFSFMDYDYTAKMEKQLDLIEAGKITYLDMLNEFYPKFKAELDKAYTDFGTIMCEKCGNPMIERTNKKDNSKFLACSGYPKCYNTKSL